MVTIRKVNSSLLDARPKSQTRALTPAQQRRLEQDQQLRAAIAKLRAPADVYEISLEADEKPITVRQRLLRLASASGTEIVVRKHGKGLLIGLLIPERRTNRGRRRGGE